MIYTEQARSYIRRAQNDKNHPLRNPHSYAGQARNLSDYRGV